MSNIYDHAYELESAIRKTNEYMNLKKAYQAIQADPTAKRTFDSFRQIQIRYQEKGMRGEAISQIETSQMQSQMQQASQNPLIGRLMTAEQKLSVLLNDVNKIMSKPLDEIYGK